MAKKRGLTKVVWHAFLDGRDTPPKSAAGYLRTVAAKLGQIGVGQLASAVGRYYAMDRDKRWDRLEIAWKMLTRGEGQARRRSRGRRRGLVPRRGHRRGGDDRRVRHAAPREGCRRQAARRHPRRRRVLLLQLPRRPRAPADARALAADADFPHFDRAPRPKLAAFATMSQYDAKVPVPAAFPPQSFDMILSEVLSKAGLTQLRTAETEKYGHVTYFFNGGVEQPFPARSGASCRRTATSRRTTSRPRCRPRPSPTASSRRSGPTARLHPRELRQPRHGGPHGQARARP